ncbi:MAG: class I SAM-dependent methyltransferase [Gammaproteobacteria bacterium]|nr:class I SAM-dependent methyltransferase [Gammaproteobacteria bacterium]
MKPKTTDSILKSNKKNNLTASTADRHWLYEQSVQDVEEEVVFLDKTFSQRRGRMALSLREDFCGTAAAACRWVDSHPDRTATGVDIDPEVLNWGRENNVSKLETEKQLKVELLQQDVMTVETPEVDLLVAFNFSYWIFKTRNELRRYFEQAYKGVKSDGLFMLDAFGGSEAHDEMKEKTKLDGFKYIWDQAEYDPVTGDLTCHIHFKFNDGTRMKRAFSYHWRLWTLPEIRELLIEAGFKNVTVYWEGTDDDGEGTGEYLPVTRGEADPAWIAYLVAEK